MEGAAATAPVVIDGHVLFHVPGVAALPAEQRAARIRNRIVALARDPAFQPEALQLTESALGVKITAGTKAVTTVVEADARLEGVNPLELAHATLDRIRGAIVAYRGARSPERLLTDGLYALGATALLVGAVVLVIWLTRRLDALVERRVRGHIGALGIQSFELVRAEHLRDAFGSLLRGLRALAILALTLVYLHFVLSRFPWTHGLAIGLGDAAGRPLVIIGRSLFAAIPNLIFLAILFFLVRFVLRALRLFFDAVARGSVAFSGFEAEWAGPTYKLVRVAVVAFGVIVAYPYIPGSESAAFKGVSLFLGVVFSLGSSSAISNMIAGYMMTYRRAFKVGDRVQIGDVIGDVVEMRLQVTHLRSLKHEEVIIPELADPQRPGGELQLAGAGAGVDSAHHGGDRLRSALAAGGSHAALGRRAHTRAARGAASVHSAALVGRLRRQLRAQRVLRRGAAHDAALHGAAPQHPRCLQRVRRADHDARVRARPG